MDTIAYTNQRRDALIHLLICKRVGQRRADKTMHVRNALFMLIAGINWRCLTDSELCMLDNVESLPVVWSAEREHE
jgi:hypothetical protein